MHSYSRTRRLARSAVRCLTALLVSSLALAQSAEAEVSAQEQQRSGPSRRAQSSRISGSIDVDGDLGDVAWRAVEVQGGFWQREPKEGAPLQFDTEFRVAHDDQALYIGVNALDAESDSVRGLLTRRDEDSASDWLWVAIDSYHDRRTAFAFALNPAGVQRDAVVTDDGASTDFSWNAVWDGAVRVHAQGWSAEFRIPFSQLRFIDAADKVWGLQIARHVQRAQEDSFWVPWPKNSAGQVSQFGELAGIEGVQGGGGLEVTPFGVAGLSHAPHYSTDTQPVANMGVDAKYALTTNLTLSATVNPDFGQVEVDPSNINLTDSETFLQEKRPFFLEGSDLFRQRLSFGDGDNAVEELFYTRRIGAAPHGGLVDDDPGVRLPSTTRIYGAAKLSGKTASGWSVGALNAVTAAESVQVQAGQDTTRTRMLEPLTNYTVLSVHKDLWQGRTRVGGVATAVHRDLSAPELRWLHDQAYAGSLDLSHRFADDTWIVQGKVFGSSVFGDPTAIAETQTASQRYYQRPDAYHLRFDPHRTSLMGFGGQAMVGRVGGEFFRGAVGADTRSPGFEVNDLGFQHSADYAIPWLWLQLRDDKPGALLRNWSVNTNGWGNLDYGGRLLGAGGNINGYARLLNYWSGSAGLAYNANFWRTGALRGGPALRGSPNWSGWASLQADPRSWVQASVGGYAQKAVEDDSWGANLWSELSLRVAGGLELAMGPFWRKNLDALQYVETTETDDGKQAFVLGQLDQTTYGMTARVNYTFSPSLSLQAYAQPYFGAGKYPHYKQVVAAGADRYADRFARLDTSALSTSTDILSVDRDSDGVTDYSFSRADFNFRELKASVVMRWEYLPGSTLFLAYSHVRTSEAQSGELDVLADVVGLAGASGEHVLMAKLAHRFEI